MATLRNSRGDRKDLRLTSIDFYKLESTGKIRFEPGQKRFTKPRFVVKLGKEVVVTRSKALAISVKITSTWDLLSNASNTKLLKIVRFIAAERPGLTAYCLSI